MLVTGFGPFPGVPVNPTAAVASALDGARVAGVRVVGRVLPVDWAAGLPALDAAVAEVAPDALLMLGVAPRGGIEVERVARNQVNAKPDVQGLAGPATLAPDGPAELATTLPWEALCALGAQPSDDAGGYLCNAVFYRALWAHAQVPQRGFVHVPHGDPAPVLAFVRRAVGVLAQGPAQARDQAGIDQSMGA
ncbi:MAG: hypothetical protein H6702_04295 [Myxococcales bacterium]|nr:hypothetical protein [Myxococcales bacterium]